MTRKSNLFVCMLAVLGASALLAGSGAQAATITLFEVEVAISWQAGGGRRSVVLNSLRLG